MTHRAYRSRGWRELRLYVLARDGYRCRVRLPGCIGRATEADHIQALADGGAWLDPHNLRASCKPCNVARGNMLRARRKRPSAEPEHVGPSRDWG